MSHAERITNAILDLVSACTEDHRREAAEDLETIMHEIACEHVVAAQHRYGPIFRSTDKSTVQVNDLQGKTAYIVCNGDGISIEVLRAFIAAVDAAK